MSNALPPEESNEIVACTISRDVQNFDLLIEDMEVTLGERWGDLSFLEALAFFGQPEAQSLEFVALAMNEADEEDVALLGDIITQAKAQKIAVILIAEDVRPATLHALLRKGADEFVPYPLPENELAEAIERIRNRPDEAQSATGQNRLASGNQKEGAVIVTHGLAGGTGSTTLAVNLAWELANVTKEDAPSVCLLDLDMQFGSVATYLDLQRREAVYEMLSDTENMDDEQFDQALLSYEDKLRVLTAPAEILPLDLLTSDDITRVLNMARRHFDYVVIDMPSAIVGWTEVVLHMAHVYFATIEQDMRSAQNALHFKRALQSEDLPAEKLRYVVNRAPKFTDLSGKNRIKRMGESLGISLDVQLPDGGKAVTQSADHGQPLMIGASKNPLRKEIAKLAISMHALTETEVQAA